MLWSMSDFLSRLTEALKRYDKIGSHGDIALFADAARLLVESEPMWCEKDDAPGISPTACWAVKFDGPCRMVERRMIDLPGENE